ncbi:c-type cytochrome [Hyphococcus flavus]|uniref:C-type cytochrome n=1 Tax=Hyphococcus flavus TaxID=1866326 RepID=A0AAE9ZFK7_9PROT|nr:c-type cytochrome [Hyphococcus flavus]WDI31832.1 c-type cytochrome [Hyphococcus flavus]
MRTHIAAATLSTFLAACGAETSAPASNSNARTENAASPARVSLRPAVKRQVDPAHGRELFVEKGCVICHSANGVGGKAAPALDAHIGDPQVDPLDFAARMWRGAPAMIELQSVELGYTIYLTAEEIADLAAFAADREAQKKLTPESLPENIADSLLDQRFWEMEDWDDYLSRGREGEVPTETLDEAPVDRN